MPDRKRTSSPVAKNGFHDMTANPNPVDIHVGGRVRLRRTLLGMSQEKLGQALGLTFQQVQKYERGANRIGSSRLYHLSQILDVPIAFFFDDMPAEILSGASGMGEQIQQRFELDPLVKRETLELVRAYYRITDTRVRKRLFEMVKAVARMSVASDK
jgi:transcriptional regulator with XRE-family HTH domain